MNNSITTAMSRAEGKKLPSLLTMPSLPFERYRAAPNVTTVWNVLDGSKVNLASYTFDMHRDVISRPLNAARSA